MRVTLIQCTDSKHDEPSKAKNLYTESSYFRAMRSWAKARGNGWYILSAKHGLLPPERKIEPYNAVGLSEEQAAEIANTLEEMGVKTVSRSSTGGRIP